MSRSDLERFFPSLRDAEYEITSPEDDGYNCIAWAAGDIERWWWPHPDAYWPHASLEVSVDAFVRAFAEFGYSPCDCADLETGWEKVAIYAEANKPTHMARQLSTGRWTSKCGENNDITHGLGDLAGDTYGEVVAILKRPAEELS